MRVYEKVWRGTCAVVATMGLGVGLLEWSALGVLLTLVPLAVLCWLLRQVFSDVIPGSSSWSASPSHLRQSLAVAIGILAVCSFGWVSPSLGLFVVLTAGVSSPPVVRRALLSARGPVVAAPTHSRRDPRSRLLPGRMPAPPSSC